MVFPRPDGGYFTTLAPDRTYKTEKGARQAQRLFENPSMQIQNRWQLIRVGEPEPETETEIVTVTQPELEQDTIPNITPDIDQYEETYTDPATRKEYALRSDKSYDWYSLSGYWQQLINEVNSDYRTKSRLIESGFETVYLSDFLEDAQDKYPECPWSFSDIISDLAGEDDIYEITEE